MNTVYKSTRCEAIEKIYGKITGLKSSQQDLLQRLYRRKVDPHEITSRELARQIAAISRDIRRQVAVLITRKGEIAYVITGDHNRIQIPDLNRVRLGADRLVGLRCIHTHLNGEPLSREDETDLVLLGLDMMVVIEVDDKGIPGPITYAHMLPSGKKEKGISTTRVPDVGRLNVDFLAMIQSLEEELARKRVVLSVGERERALLVGVEVETDGKERESMEELKELAISDDIEVIGTVVQRIRKADPRLLLRKGKLSELALTCLQTGAGLLVFNNELTPAQVNSLAEYTDLKIIDRSQLILDIFARRAITREGKIQVELAQLKYLLPRLAAKNTAMSRLTGGIGARGPGETKLEINRRRVRDRIARLNRELKEIKKQRQGRRTLRESKGLPVISIVGYTNAGKSTLLNALTSSSVAARNRMFETLDPSSRRLRFPREREAIITDTVGFIRKLPESLMDAFAATLEELHDADLLLHVVDASSPRFEEQIKTVDKTLAELGLSDVPTLIVYNKTDLLKAGESDWLSDKDGVAVSAISPDTLRPLVERIEQQIWTE